MWKEKDRNGWRYIERYTDQNGKEKRTSVVLKRAGRAAEDEARALLKEKIAKKTGLAYTPAPSEVTLKVLIDKYLTWQREQHKEQTADVSERHLKKIKGLIGPDIKLCDIDAGMIRQKLDTGSASLYNGRIKHVKALVRWSYRFGYLDSVTLADRLERRTDKEAKQKLQEKYLESDEIKKLLEGAKVDRWRHVIRIMILSGLRIGELMALREDDIDYASGLISVTKTYSINIEKETSTKTEAGERVIPIQSELMEELIDADFWKRADVQRYGYSSSLLIPGADGKYFSYRAFSKYLAELSERMIGRRITSHALRHTHVSLLAAAGVDLETISRRIGHSDSDVTRDIYFHITKQLINKDAEKVRQIRLIS